jgi:hypothetical protein
VLNSRAPVVVSNTEICVLICLSLTDINAWKAILKVIAKSPRTRSFD